MSVSEYLKGIWVTEGGYKSAELDSIEVELGASERTSSDQIWSIKGKSSNKFISSIEIQSIEKVSFQVKQAAILL